MTASTDLTGRTALVTGGSRGIGHGVAQALASAGARVVVTARSTESAETAATAIGHGARGVAMDVGVDSQVTEGVAALIEDCGTIDILVNNAGITRDTLLMRMKPEDWDAVLRTNLSGVYRLCRAVVPTMVRARFGRIVNVTSVVAAIGNAGQVNYAASKAGIEGFSRSLARELASRSVTVNCVAPGFIDTDMTRALGESARAKLLEQVPLKRLGTVDDIAAAVLYLVGPGGDWVTGITLPVNGGMSM